MKVRIIPWWFRKWDEEVGKPVRIKADFTAVSAVNERVLKLLRKNLIPNVIASREEIGLCSPKDHGDIVLGVYLYDIRENSEIRMTGMVAEDNLLKFPPLHLDLYYMITAYSRIHIQYREEENHRILAKVMQVFHDYPKMGGEDYLHAEFLNLTMEQKSPIWNHLGGGYQLSLFYKVSPVRLDSTRQRETVRVREISVEAVPQKILEGGL